MNIESLIEMKPNPNIPELAPGDTVKVSSRVVEGGKERIQVLQGVVIRLRNSGAGTSFTVRHVAYGIGVERTFPLYSPRVEKVVIVRHGKVRRAKLYYLRERSGKSARIRERRLSPQEVELEREAASKLKQEEALKQEQKEASRLQQEQQTEAKQPQGEAPKMEQEPLPEAEPEQEAGKS